MDKEKDSEEDGQGSEIEEAHITLASGAAEFAVRVKRRDRIGSRAECPHRLEAQAYNYK